MVQERPPPEGTPRDKLLAAPTVARIEDEAAASSVEEADAKKALAAGGKKAPAKTKAKAPAKSAAKPKAAAKALLASTRLSATISPRAWPSTIFAP